MDKKVKVDDIQKAIMKALNDYAGAAEEDCTEAAKETAKNAAKKLRKAHPAGSGTYRSWKEYNKGWKVKTSTKKGKAKTTVHNSEHYRLTHLLENGHAKVKGGRTRAFPHIAPVAEAASEEFVQNVKKRIENN